MTTTPASAPRPTDLELQTRILQIIADAYAPEDCEQCEGNEGTCRECAEDALHDAGIRTAFNS